MPLLRVATERALVSYAVYAGPRVPAGFMYECGIPPDPARCQKASENAPSPVTAKTAGEQPEMVRAHWLSHRRTPCGSSVARGGSGQER